MARSRKPTPSYLFHKATGRAHAVWTDATGAHLQKLLPGKYDSTESRTAFAQLQLEIEASPLQSPDIHSERVSVNELMLAYIEHAEQHYRGPEGKPTGETQHVKVVCRYVRELYGHTLAVEFGPLALKAVRQKFVKAGWCRRSVNQQIERVRRAFRWAAGEELIPFEVYHRLTAVSGLQRGRTEAREPDPVKPVDDAIVDATLQHLSRHVRGLVEFQRLTGCRPGEACRLRRCDIETGGTVWLYRPPQHKGSWRGKSRTIAIGPKAQELLKEFFTANITDHLFSPRRAVEEVRAVRAKNRKTPRYPSHLKRNATKRKTNPKRTPSDRYNRVSYVVAVARACDRAYPPRGDLAQRPCETTEAWKTRLKLNQPVELRAWQKAHRWSPNQLRHSYATKVRKEHGLETPGVRISFALHRLGVTQGEPDGPDEDEIRARSNQNNVRRQSHGPGPFIFVAPSRPGEAGHAHITLHLILHPRHQVRAAALAHIEQSPEGDTAWLVPRSRSVIAEYRNALLSKASNVWQPAVARLSDVLEEDFLLNMAAYRQCVVVGLGAEELVYWGRIIRPGLSLFASVPDTWYAAPTPSTWQEEINVMVHDSGSLRECLDRYLKRFGHLPLASPFSAGACVRSWVEARGGSDTVWGEVWDWANETLDPLRRYHAVQVFLECPYVTSESRRKEAWDAVADVLSWARLRTDSTNPYATGWELRVELARHYLGHLELYAIDQPGDR
ncbi:MAG TPA: hypothetical protein VG122_05685, partial [Gemmata sp.]|nr:hypothetical protein [Gemmata sp.]